ncbi:class I SAM-dependent methyltransferase [Kineococcus sp. SYSU DK006]|uniref:class I SAM-dependent methyltransferase n=1 Tax=Kineococcus sp. SYSU DK006 TaxID=3383127 RepID=UPI003D7F119E
MGETDVDVSSQEFWDQRYRGGPLFSGHPNPWLVHHASALPPGTALDVGCGEGADSLWLAARGWHVTGVDISPVALARAARLAEDAGAEVVARTSWQQADALHLEPSQARFDLVSAQYLHLPAPGMAELHRRLAAAVRPGGTLLLVLHEPPRPGSERPDVPADVFATAEEMAAGLDPAAWTVHAGRHARPVADPPHPAGHTHDVVLHAVRRVVDPARDHSTATADRPPGSYWSMDEARWVLPA